ncbi:MAG: adenosine kinase [Pseudomonadaceae bacterium]|nr:adenosine kinase [Pseudomonadaceae bacterium]
MAKSFDVFGLGNALVDQEYKVDDSFLAKHEIAKGHMTLVDEDRLNQLIAALAEIEPMKRCSGGSAANTIYAVQAFGGRSYYACRVAGDPTGAFFLSDLAAAGVKSVAFNPEIDGQSGRVLVLITPDAERSMNTFLGISEGLDSKVLNDAALIESSVCYIEGYLSSSPESTAVARACFDTALANGVETSLSLSDPSMVEFCRDGLTTMLGNGVHTLFCNEEEALTWAGTDRLDIAITELKDIGQKLFVTLGAKGSIYVDQHAQKEAAAEAVKAVDSNGAGDIYAGACLWALTAGMDGGTAARFGNHAAAQLVQRFGARLEGVADYQAVGRAFSR